MAHKEIGYELIDKIMEHLSEDAILEQKPQMAGRNLSVVIRSNNAKAKDHKALRSVSS